LRIGNQGRSGAEDSYALYIDAQSGSASSNYGAYINGNTIIDSSNINFTLSGTAISMSGPNGNSILLDDGGNVIDFNAHNASGNFGGFIDKTNGILAFGDGGNNNAVKLTVDDTNKLIQLNSRRGVVNMGDIDSAFNQTTISLDDNTSSILIHNGGGQTIIGDTDSSEGSNLLSRVYGPSSDIPRPGF
jgi:hypothetical protein